MIWVALSGTTTVAAISESVRISAADKQYSVFIVVTPLLGNDEPMFAWGVPNAKKPGNARISAVGPPFTAVNFANGSQNSPKIGSAPN